MNQNENTIPVLQERSLEEQEKLQKAAKQYIENNAYHFYEPNLKAEEFVQEFGRGDKLVYMFLGGNGTSKSCTLANILANICFESKNRYFKGPLYQRWPHLKDIRIVSDPTTLEQKTCKEIEKWFPRGRYRALRNQKKYNSMYKTDTGFTIYLMSYEQDIKEFESADLGCILLDEPPPEQIFNACISRLRLGGVLGIFFTPLASAGYLYDRYIDNPKGIERATWVEVDVEDNCLEHGVRGFLKHDNIVQMVENYDESERDARVHGRFMHLAGTIFKEFDSKKHILEDFERVVPKWNRGSWKVYWSIDPHPVMRTAVSFMALMDDNRKVIIDEIWESADIKTIASRIWSKLKYFKSLGGQVAEIGLIDPSAVIEDKLRGGTSVKTDFLMYCKKQGFKMGLIEASKDRDRAEDLIHQELKGTINPNLYFCSNVTQTIWEIRRYATDPKHPGKRPDKDDHFIEAIGRLIIANPHALFSQTREEKRRKHIIGIGTQ